MTRVLSWPSDHEQLGGEPTWERSEVMLSGKTALEDEALRSWRCPIRGYHL